MAKELVELQPSLIHHPFTVILFYKVRVYLSERCKIFKTNKKRGLYPEATKFVVFDVLKRRLAQDPGNATVPERFAAGGLAGAAAQTLVYPLEIVKTRMAVSSPGGDSRSRGVFFSDIG